MTRFIIGSDQGSGNFQGPELLAAPGIFQGDLEILRSWKFPGPLENSRILDISRPPWKIPGGSLSPVRHAVLVSFSSAQVVFFQIGIKEISKTPLNGKLNDGLFVNILDCNSIFIFSQAVTIFSPFRSI